MPTHSEQTMPPHDGGTDNFDGSDVVEGIEGLESIFEWDWPATAAREHARELVLTVAAAQAADRRDDAQVLYTNNESRGRWELAVLLAAQLRQITPGPFPQIVEDALAATDASAAEDLLTDDPGNIY